MPCGLVKHFNPFSRVLSSILNDQILKNNQSECLVQSNSFDVNLNEPQIIQ